MPRIFEKRYSVPQAAEAANVPENILLVDQFRHILRCGTIAPASITAWCRVMSALPLIAFALPPSPGLADIPAEGPFATQAVRKSGCIVAS